MSIQNDHRIKYLEQRMEELRLRLEALEHAFQRIQPNTLHLPKKK